MSLMPGHALLRSQYENALRQTGAKFEYLIPPVYLTILVAAHAIQPGLRQSARLFQWSPAPRR
jgi:hypothetical protein